MFFLDWPPGAVRGFILEWDALIGSLQRTPLGRLLLEAIYRGHFAPVITRLINSQGLNHPTR